MPIRASAMFVTTTLLGLLTTAAAADPLPDPSHTITIQLENDSTRPGSDNYYTGGERIAYTCPQPARSLPRSPLLVICYWATGSNDWLLNCRKTYSHR